MAPHSADPEPAIRTSAARRSDRFLLGLKPATRVTFVSHVHPDPDSLGSMLGLAHLVGSKLDKPVRLTRDGHISRAENKAMVELLDLELQPVEELSWQPGEAVVMVDSQPNTGRHSLKPDAPLYAVLDHHDTPGDTSHVPFVDVRRQIGATCSLVTKYLIEQAVAVPKRVATALMYGIETEVCGYPREAGPVDDDALKFLYPLADKDLVARIRNARVPHSHFECLLQALQSSFVYDRLVISWVKQLPAPELAAEIVDFMIRFEEVDYALCCGLYKDTLVLSMRSSLHDARAGDVLRAAVGDLGKAGGHDRRAGGCIKLANPCASKVDEVQSELRRRLLKALNIEETRGQRLVRLREMLQNLQA